jgi:hypothetical protein
MRTSGGDLLLAGIPQVPAHVDPVAGKEGDALRLEHRALDLSASEHPRRREGAGSVDDPVARQPQLSWRAMHRPTNHARRARIACKLGYLAVGCHCAERYPGHNCIYPLVKSAFTHRAYLGFPHA